MALMPLQKHKIQDIEIAVLLLALKERWGYDFSGYAKASLKRRLLELVNYFEVDCLSRLLPTMLYDQALAQTIINAISVPTSEFFRDPLVWLEIRQQLIPRLSSFPRINVWQVGCGYGQETYTLAILLHEAGLSNRIRLVTTDINSDFLQQAQKGCWPKHHFELWQQNYHFSGGCNRFEDYFEFNHNQISIRPELKTAIEFVQHNLVVDDVFLETQLIVCRNVLIYFGIELQDRVLDVFSRSLQHGGYLLLGKAESLPETLDNRLDLESFNADIHLYRKKMRKNDV